MNLYNLSNVNLHWIPEDVVHSVAVVLFHCCPGTFHESDDFPLPMRPQVTTSKATSSVLVSSNDARSY